MKVSTGIAERKASKLWIAATVLAVVPAAAHADCLRAVFFDLGETLVTAAGGGMFTLKPGAQETVDALQAAGRELGIITNVPGGWTREDLEAILLQPEFLDEFDVLTLSSQAPAPKPDPAIYLFAHAALPTPVPVGATAFVGESLPEIANAEVSPTLGARAAGMIGVHVSSAAPSPLADFTIPPGDLPQVLAVVTTTCTAFVDGFESGDTSSWSACAGCG
jgi:FMN phosphatase YigB (HAD superfamily)